MTVHPNNLDTTAALNTAASNMDPNFSFVGQVACTGVNGNCSADAQTAFAQLMKGIPTSVHALAPMAAEATVTAAGVAGVMVASGLGSFAAAPLAAVAALAIATRRFTAPVTTATNDLDRGAPLPHLTAQNTTGPNRRT